VARLEQVVWNLLTNAVKFTPPGGRVDVRLAQVETSIELVVSDTGSGIAEEFLPRLFERFSQADSRSTRAYSGLGLGLALVKHFVELHGGTVTGTSEGPGKGATFRVALPAMEFHREKLSGAAPADTTKGYRDHRLRGLTVLAVDDDPDSLLLLLDALQSAGASVVCAESATKALEILNGERPDVIVSDLAMPEMDGFDFIASVRKRDSRRGGAIPAAALTAFARDEDRNKALRAGYQIHLAKPIDPAELVDAVAALGQRPQGSRPS
jgi:CheY-like chemotaxis protein